MADQPGQSRAIAGLAGFPPFISGGQVGLWLVAHRLRGCSAAAQAIRLRFLRWRRRVFSVPCRTIVSVSAVWAASRWRRRGAEGAENRTH